MDYLDYIVECLEYLAYYLEYLTDYLYIPDYLEYLADSSMFLAGYLKSKTIWLPPGVVSRNKMFQTIQAQNKRQH